MKIVYLAITLIILAFASPARSQVIIVCDEDGNCGPVVVFPQPNIGI